MFNSGGLLNLKKTITRGPRYKFDEEENDDSLKEDSSKSSFASSLSASNISGCSEEFKDQQNMNEGGSTERKVDSQTQTDNNKEESASLFNQMLKQNI